MARSAHARARARYATREQKPRARTHESTHITTGSAALVSRARWRYERIGDATEEAPM